MWKHIRTGLILGGFAVPSLFLVLGQILASSIPVAAQNDYFVFLNALKVTFWPSSIFEMFDPTSERNWKLIGLAGLVNAILYGVLAAMLLRLRASSVQRLLFWIFVSVLAAGAGWVLAGVVWPVVVVGTIAVVDLVLANRLDAPLH